MHFEKSDFGGNCANVEISSNEFDRFISNRPIGSDLAQNFENKEHILHKRVFACNKAVDEQCTSSTCNQNVNDCHMEQASTQTASTGHKIYNTLLTKTMFDADNPHCLEQGAHNEEYDEDMGGIIQADRLSLKYNVLNFRLPERQQRINSLTYEETQETSLNFGANVSCNDSFSNMPAYNTSPKHQQ